MVRDVLRTALQGPIRCRIPLLWLYSRPISGAGMPRCYAEMLFRHSVLLAASQLPP